MDYSFRKTDRELEKAKKEDFLFSYQFWNKHALQSTLRDIKSTILQYEDEISAINSKKITISLYQSSITLLGL